MIHSLDFARCPYAGRASGAGQLHDAVPGQVYALLNVLALHGLVLALSVGWQAHIRMAPHLFIAPGIALGFKAILIPVALRRMISRMGLHREVETVGGIGLTMLAGIALVALSLQGCCRQPPLRTRWRARISRVRLRR